MRVPASLFVMVLSAGCATVDVGELGPSSAPAARLTADPRFNAGLPVTVALRKIDDIEVGPFYSHARLSAGPHRVLVDCSVIAAQSTTRFELKLDAEPGARYRLVAELEPGNRSCREVRVETH